MSKENTGCEYLIMLENHCSPAGHAEPGPIVSLRFSRLSGCLCVCHSLGKPGNESLVWHAAGTYAWLFPVC